MRDENESATCSEPSDEGLESYKVCWKVNMYAKQWFRQERTARENQHDLGILKHRVDELEERLKGINGLSIHKCKSKTKYYSVWYQLPWITNP